VVVLQRGGQEEGVTAWKRAQLCTLWRMTGMTGSVALTLSVSASAAHKPKTGHGDESESLGLQHHEQGKGLQEFGFTPLSNIFAAVDHSGPEHTNHSKRRLLMARAKAGEHYAALYNEAEVKKAPNVKQEVKRIWFG